MFTNKISMILATHLLLIEVLLQVLFSLIPASQTLSCINNVIHTHTLAMIKLESSNSLKDITQGFDQDQFSDKRRIVQFGRKQYSIQ